MLTASLAVGLIASEAVLRLVGYAPGEFRLFRPNPSGQGSHRLIPNLAITIPMEGVAIPVRINSHGMRWPEVPLARPAGRARVAMVGDSYTFGQWADRVEDAFVGVAASALADQAIDLLNFGVPGYGFEDMELIIREQVLRFAPDAIVLVSFNGNDFLDTYLGLGRYQISPRGALRIDERRLGAIPAEFRPDLGVVKSWVTRHLYLARAAGPALAAFGSPGAAAAGARGDYQRAPALERIQLLCRHAGDLHRPQRHEDTEDEPSRLRVSVTPWLRRNEKRSRGPRDAPGRG